jgi:hypothetical protein
MSDEHPQEDNVPTMLESIRKSLSGYTPGIATLVAFVLIWVLLSFDPEAWSPEGLEKLEFLIIAYALILAAIVITAVVRRR